MYILLAILIFGVLIFTHELGHFLAAKLFGVRVNEFALCMGPAIFQKKVGETTYSLRCIPIGGYCAMEGEDETSDDPRAFTSAKPWKRAIILVAGAAMNFLTGFLILLCMYSVVAGFKVPAIGEFMENCPLETEIGLQEGDEFYRIDGRRVYSIADFDMFMDRNDTGVYDLVIKRDGDLIEMSDVPMARRPYENDGVIEYKFGFYPLAVENSFAMTWKMACYTSIDYARMVWLSVGDLIQGLVSVDDMSGPVGIVNQIAETGKSSENALSATLNIANLAAFIAINLAVMNLLPIPALDGGRVFFLVITWIVEKLTRKKLDPKYEGYIHAAGMVLLLAFIAYVSLKDIWKIITL